MWKLTQHKDYADKRVFFRCQIAQKRQRIIGSFFHFFQLYLINYILTKFKVIKLIFEERGDGTWVLIPNPSQTKDKRRPHTKQFYFIKKVNSEKWNLTYYGNWNDYHYYCWYWGGHDFFFVLEVYAWEALNCARQTKGFSLLAFLRKIKSWLYDFSFKGTL